MTIVASRPIRVTPALLVLVAVLLGARSAAAQYQVDSWTTDNGLPQNVVGAILQSRDGYLWLATRDGLVRFDGVRFTVFNRNNSPGIRNNRFTKLYEADDGAIWAGTEGGGVTRYINGTFVTFTTEDGLIGNQVYGVTGDRAGNIWVLSGGQILHWNGTRFRAAETGGVMAPFVSSAWNPQVFLAIDRKGLHRFSKGEFSRRPLPPGIAALSNNRIEEDADGTLWMSTIDGRLARIRDNGVLFDRIPDREAEAGRVASAYRDRNGHEWPLRVSRSMSRLWTFPESPDAPVALLAIFEDREGNLWLGADGKGLYRVRQPRVAVLSQAQGLLARNIYPVLMDRSGSVWMGVWPSGVSRLTNGRVANYTVADGLPSVFVTSLAEDRQGRIWVAGHSDRNGGLRIFDNGRFMDAPALVPGQSIVHAILHDRAGTIWLGTTDGLARAHAGAVTMITTADGLAGNDVQVIVEDRDGRIWLGTDGGISSWHAGEIRTWTDRDGLPSGVVRALYVDRDGVLWIGTYDGGLGRYKDGRFSRFTTREGLYDNGVFQILEDAGGYLWMSSNRGIHRVSKRELDAVADRIADRVTSLSLGKDDGLLNAECNGGTWPAGTIGPGGKLLFPTQEGVAVIDPETIAASSRPVPPRIEAVLVDRTEVPPGVPVRMTPGQQALEIQYTGLSLVNSDRIRFRYRMDGLDHEWVDVGTRRTAYYSHIPPGNYTFTVAAAGSDGVWTTTVATLPVRVIPPFWQTWWFPALGIIATVGAGALAYRRRVATLEHARHAQERFARQLIDSQEQERRRIAAELHDSLGQHLVVIKNRAQLGSMTGGDGPNTQFEEISASATRCLEEVKHISYNLRPYHLDRLGLATSIEAMAEQIGASSGIECMVTIPPEIALARAVSKDQEINVYRIVQESLNNVVKHSGATRATIEIADRGPELVITIADNGKGFDPRATRAAAIGSGFGLAGVAERVGMIGGRHSVVSSPGQGTTVTIALPRRFEKEAAV